MHFKYCVFACLLLVPSAGLQTPAQPAKPIEEKEVSAWLNQNGECPADREPYFSSFDETDLKGDGTPQVIVVASTCMTGTAGPDIHSVFSRDATGELIELPIAEADPKTFDNLFGNRNYDLSEGENGLLVATFRDDGDRPTPLVIKYKWNGKEFAIVSIQKTGIFPTSYDCKKAQSEIENAICHVESLAALDRQLADTYKAVLAKSSPQEREDVKSEQRDWLDQRNKQCGPYKSWVSCLTDSYQKRIEALKKPLPAPMPAASAQKP
jgi:uncharacterized protein YecT (DUF1311 family)